MAAQSVGTMSGGEKARLVLAMLVWQRPNLLLLDEPTNHLDLVTREALAMALNGFEGALLLVSHDRALLRAVCDEFWLVAMSIYIALSSAFKTQEQILANPLALPAPFTFDNIIAALSRPDQLVQGGLINSVIVTASTLVILVPLAAAVSFCISQRRPLIRNCCSVRSRSASWCRRRWCCCRSSTCCRRSGSPTPIPA